MVMLKDVNEKVYKIIGSCMEVHRTLGPGYPPEFYKKALEIEFESKELAFETHKSLQVEYKEMLVGTIEIDFLIEEKVVVMIRSQDNLEDVEVQQMLRYISLTGGTIGVIMNFGAPKIQYKRVLPGHAQREVRKEPYRYMGSREIGKTREGNPIS